MRRKEGRKEKRKGGWERKEGERDEKGEGKKLSEDTERQVNECNTIVGNSLIFLLLQESLC